jgi:predicted anti-sigma-YlaC factor YlaD
LAEENTDWIKAAGGALTGIVGAALGIGIPKSVAQMILGAGKAVTGVAGLADIGIGVGALSQIPRQRDDFYKGALLGLGAWEVLAGVAMLLRSIASPSGIQIRIGRGGNLGTYTVRKGE